MVRLLTSQPSVGSAANELVSAMGDLATSLGRWVALQPAARQAPVYAERLRRASAATVDGAGAWAGDTATRVRTRSADTATRVRKRSADAASTTRTGLVNVGLVALLLWWVDRVLTADADR